MKMLNEKFLEFIHICTFNQEISPSRASNMRKSDVI